MGEQWQAAPHSRIPAEDDRSARWNQPLAFLVADPDSSTADVLARLGRARYHQTLHDTGRIVAEYPLPQDYSVHMVDICDYPLLVGVSPDVSWSRSSWDCCIVREGGGSGGGVRPPRPDATTTDRSCLDAGKRPRARRRRHRCLSDLQLIARRRQLVGRFGPSISACTASSLDLMPSTFNTYANAVTCFARDKGTVSWAVVGRTMADSSPGTTVTPVTQCSPPKQPSHESLRPQAWTQQLTAAICSPTRVLPHVRDLVRRSLELVQTQQDHTPPTDALDVARDSS